jgi:predicted nucleic acid-binding protein
MMVIGEVAVQDAAQMPLAEDENVIQALASDRTDQALHERILPGTERRGENFLDSDAPHVAKAKRLHQGPILSSDDAR